MTARQDLAQFLIKEATGYEVSDFLKLFGSLSSKMQTKLITNDNVSEALRMLSAGDSKIDNMLKIASEPNMRVNRLALRNHYSTHEGLKNFTDRIRNLYDDAQKIKNVRNRATPADLSENDFNIFAKLYESQNPYLMTQIKESLGEKYYLNFLKRTVRKNKISKDSREFYDQLTKKGFYSMNNVISRQYDEAAGRAYNLLKRYKEIVPKTTGSELRTGIYNFGHINTNKLFELDPYLKEFLSAKNIRTTRGSEYLKELKRKKILNMLKAEGLLDELGMDTIRLQGGPPKVRIHDDPKIKQFIFEEAQKGNPSLINTNMIGLLDENQKMYYNDFIRLVKKNIVDSNLDNIPLMRQFNSKAKTHGVRMADLLRANFNRYMRFSIFEGKSIDEAFDGFKKQVERKDFMKKALPIIYDTVRLRDKIKYNFNKYGIEFPELTLSHKAAVVDDMDKAFRANNIFTGERILNAEENAIASKIRRLKTKAQQKGGSKILLSDQALRNLDREIKDLEYELEIGGYYEPISKDFESKMDQAITDISTAGGFLFKDGGFASIEDVLDYNNG